MLVLIYKAGGLVYKKVKLWGQLNRNISRKRKKKMWHVSSICCQRKHGVNMFLVCLIFTRSDCICAQTGFLSSFCCEWPWEVTVARLSFEMAICRCAEDIYPLAAWQQTIWFTFKHQFVFDSQTLRGRRCLQSAGIPRSRRSAKCHANISVPLVMYKIYIYLHVILYKNKSIEKSPLEMIWKCFFQCKKTSLSLVIQVLIYHLLPPY